MQHHIDTTNLRGLEILQALAEKGVRFFFLAGANGAGKDLHANLLEATLLFWMKVAHVSTSAALKAHSTDKNNLGRAISKANKEKLSGKGKLFPDELAFEAIALDVGNLYNSHQFETFILTGIPRGSKQPWEVARLPNCNIISLEASLSTALKRARIRVKQALQKGEKPREDDRPVIVRSRFRDHRDITLPQFQSIAKNHRTCRVKFVDANQSIRAVFSDTLKAMKCGPEVVDDCLMQLEQRKGAVKEILKDVKEELPPIPEHWPLELKFKTITQRVADELGKPVTEVFPFLGRPNHVKVITHSTSPPPQPQGTKWLAFHQDRKYRPPGSICLTPTLAQL